MNALWNMDIIKFIGWNLLILTPTYLWAMYRLDKHLKSNRKEYWESLGGEGFFARPKEVDSTWNILLPGRLPPDIYEEKKHLVIFSRILFCYNFFLLCIILNMALKK